MAHGFLADRGDPTGRHGSLAAGGPGLTAGQSCQSVASSDPDIDL